MEIDFSRPGKPTDNGHIEAFNGRLRAECLTASWFLSLADAKDRIEEWRLKMVQARRLKELERENQRLRKAVADLPLDKLLLAEAPAGTGYFRCRMAVPS